VEHSADPVFILRCLQEYLDQEVEPIWSESHPSLLIDNSFPAGKLRFRVGLVEDGEVLSFAQVQHATVFDLPGLVLHLAYAVRENHRQKGLGEKTLRCMLDELKRYLKSIGLEQFVLMALIDHDNLPSQAVIKRFIHAAPIEEIDGDTGLPVLLYATQIQLS